MKGTNAIEEWNNGGVEAVGGSKKQLKWAKLPKESGSFKTTDGSHWIRHFVKYDASSKCDWSVYIRPWRHVHDNELSFRYPTWKVTYSSFNVQDDKQTTWAVKRILRKKQAESKSPTSGTMTLQQLSKRQTSNSSLAQKIQNDTNTVLSSQQNSLSNALLLPCARNQLAMGVGPPQRERCPNFWHDSARLNPKLRIKRTMLCQTAQEKKANNQACRQLVLIWESHTWGIASKEKHRTQGPRSEGSPFKSWNMRVYKHYTPVATSRMISREPELLKRILTKKQAESKWPTSGTMTLQQLSKRQTSNSSLAQKI